MEASGQDQSHNLPPAGSDRGQDHVLAVSRRDEQGALAQDLHGVNRLHGADCDVADGLPRRGFSGEQLTVEVRDDQLERWIGEEFAVRDAADELDPVLG